MGQAVVTELNGLHSTSQAIDKFIREKVRDGKWTKKTQNFYETHLLPFRESTDYLENITKDFVLDYVEKIGQGKKGKPAPCMKQSAFNVIKIFLTWCADEDQQFIVRCPISKKFKLGKPPARVRRIPTKNDLSLLLNYLKQDHSFLAKRNFALLKCYASTGCRLSELLGDKKNDRQGLLDSSIDWDLGEIKVFGKGERERIVYPDRTALEAMFEYNKMVWKRWPVKKTLAFWVTEEGRPLEGSGFREAFERICDKFDFPFTPHDWRRFFCTSIANSGINDVLGMEATGHKSHEQYRHYITISRQSVKSELEKHSPVAGL